MTKKIKILIPVYNEEKNIFLFYSFLHKTIKKIKKYNFKIVFIVDKSQDATEEKVYSLCRKYKNVGAIILSRRYGHQQSLLAGINNSLNDDAVIMMDGDMQHPPSLINSFLKKFELGYDIVNTERIDNSSNFLRNIINRIFYSLFRTFSGYSLKNNSADFRLINRRVTKLISQNFREKNIFLRGIISSLGFKQCHIKFICSERLHGKSKYNIFKNFKFAFSALFSYSSMPLYVSFTILAVSIFVNILILFLLLFFGKIKIILFFAVISTFLVFIFLSIYLAFIGIYIGSLMEESKNRPNYIIEKFINKQYFA